MNNPLINPGLGTFFWMVVSFAILVIILAKWGWPVILRSLKERERAIADSLNAAQRAREEMDQLKAHNEELLRQAKVERDELLRQARLTSDQIVEEARSKAAQEADRIVEAARDNINYEKLKAMHELKNQVATLSIDIAEKVLQRELGDKGAADAIIRAQLEQSHLQ